MAASSLRIIANLLLLLLVLGTRTQSMTFRPEEYAKKGEVTLTLALTCFVVFVEDVSESKEKRLEEWKYYHNPNRAPFERMEHVNRPVIYGIDLDESPEDKAAKKMSASATYKLTLRDESENYFYAIEIDKLPFLHSQASNTGTPLPVPLGGKLVLKSGTKVYNGVVCLTASSCEYLGHDENLSLAKQLNVGVVEKYIDVMERQLNT